ncbi:hypothetical protein [Amycolatopsis pigmentata]|uniref:DUF4241 domain-containing protein n=1 Tax=Amycolatopsis pigmentata TaxID=450801 RepID=A0ABW5GAH1_9PSEU
MNAGLDQLARHIAGPLCTERAGGDVCGIDWFDRVGDLVVVDGIVGWMTPELSRDGPFTHEVPPGTYPVYVGGRDYSSKGVSENRVTTVVVPMADANTIVKAEWDEEGYGDYMRLDDYACLWDERASRATLPHWAFGDADKSEAILNIERIVKSPEVLATRGKWPNVVVDPATGANVLAFPIAGDGLTGFEARDHTDEIVCLLLATQ